ncbi:Sugar ABC transporter substrate-binding protein [Pararobbsia alpina]|uniref:sugar ABC transporter substrate-binding protein n=1 Tax=Pararobbsia alpina TaxID=621374 RepID=UPI0039A5B746
MKTSLDHQTTAMSAATRIEATIGTQAASRAESRAGRKRWAAAACGLALLLGGGGAMAADAPAQPLNIVMLTHGAASNAFWQAVKRGFDDACAKVHAQCQMVFTQTDSSIEQQTANFQTALARKPDAILTTIVDDKAMTSLINDARSKNVMVIAYNVDQTGGAAGAAKRQAFVGQNFVPAGRNLANQLTAQFPKDGPVRVLIGVSAPGQNWAEQRAKGVQEGLDDWKRANPNRQLTVDRIDSSTDLAVTGDRVGAYLTAHPDTTAYFDMGFFHASVARVLKDRGVPPGKVLLAGFDIVPPVLEMMKAGYIQAEVDQQPYMQGFIPVMEVYLSKTVGLAPADVNTGNAIVTPPQAGNVLALSEKGLR